MRNFGANFVFLALVSCGGAPVSTASTGGSSPSPSASRELPSDPRTLPRGAVFEDLLAVARRLDDRGEGASDRGCLLLHEENSDRLEADLAVAVRPLPPAVPDADAILGHDPRPIEVLSRWGRAGLQDATAPLVAWTTTDPWPHDASVLVMTDRGVYVRREDAASDETNALPSESACGAASAPDRPRRAYVTAESRVPVTELVTLLTCLGSHGIDVALATFLPPDTRLPEPPPTPASRRCSEQPTQADSEGELPREALLTGIGPLRVGAGACLGAATAPTNGGALTLRVLVTPEGRVGEACPVRDELGDPGVVGCVLDLARGLVFPPPEPTGSVTFELPLRLVGDRALAQHAVCARSTPRSPMQ